MPEEASRFLVWGAGGHGKVVADLIRCQGHDVIGFVDAGASRNAVFAAENPVLLSELELLESLALGHALPAGATAIALGIGDNWARHGAYDRIESAHLPALVHPNATIAASTTIGVGSVVFAGAVVNPGASIGSAVIVNSAAVVEHDCVLEDAAHVSPGAVLTGGVHVGRYAWIGAGSTVLPGITIGERAIVGAGAVVTSDLPEDCTAVGIPAKVIKTREEGWPVS